jgi:hypothetical protein
MSLMTYELKCGALPPKTKQFVVQIASTMDHSTAEAEANNVIRAITEKGGMPRWCAVIKTIVEQMEKKMQ